MVGLGVTAVVGGGVEVNSSGDSMRFVGADVGDGEALAAGTALGEAFNEGSLGIRLRPSTAIKATAMAAKASGATDEAGMTAPRMRQTTRCG